MAGDVILGVGIRFDPAQIDISAIRKAVVGALANTEIKLAKIKIAPGAAKDALSGVEFVLGRNNFKVSNKAINSIRNSIQQGLNQNPFSITINANNLRTQVNQVLQSMGMGGGAGGGMPQLGKTPTAGASQGNMTAAAMKLRRVRQEIEAQTSQANIFAQPTSQELLKLKGMSRTSGASTPPGAGGPSPVGQGSVNQSIKQMQAFTAAQKQAAAGTAQLDNLLKQGGLSAEVMGAKIGQITERFGAYLIALKAIFAVQSLFSVGVKDIISLDNALQDLQKVLRATPEGLKSISDEMYNVARSTGQSIENVTQSVGEFVRQGLGIKAALTEATNAMILANISELNIAEATSTLTTAIRVFGKELRGSAEAMDIMSTIADKSASTTTQLSQSLIRSGAAAEAVGVSYRELNALTAAVIETTQLSGNTVGSALKTIFATLGTVRTQLIQTANAWGANITQSDNQFTVLQKLAAIYGTLDIEQKAQLANLLGGKRRFTELNALLGSFDKTQELLAKSFDSSGSAAAKNAIQLDKLSVQAQNIATSYSEFINTLAGTSKGANATDTIRSNFASILTTTNDILMLATKFINLFTGSSFIFDDIKSALLGAVQGGLFVVGPVIMKSLLAGFSNFLQLGKSINAVYGNIAQNLGQQSSAFKPIITRAKEYLGIEQQITNTLATQVKLRSRFTGNKSVNTLDPKSPESAAAQKAIAKVAIIGALFQVAMTNIDKLAISMKNSSSAAEKEAGQLLEMGASATQFGAMIAIIAGPMAGFAAALVQLSAAMVSRAVSWISSDLDTTKFVFKMRQTLVDRQEAEKMGTDAEVLFAKMARSLGAQASLGVNKIDFISKLLNDAGTLSTGIVALTKGINEEYNRVFQQIDNTMRGIDLARTMDEFRKTFDIKGLEFKAKIETGELDAAFAPVQAQFADFEARAQSIGTQMGGLPTIFEKLAAAQEALNEKTDHSEQSSEQILTSLKLHTKEYDILNDQLQQVERQSISNTKEAEAYRIEIEKIVEANKGLNASLEESNKKAQEDVKYAGEADDIRKSMKNNNDLIAKRQAEISDLSKAESKYSSLTVTLKGKMSAISEKEMDDLSEIVKSYEAFIQKIKLGIQETLAENKLIEDRLVLLSAESEAKIKIMQLEAQGGNAQQVYANKILAIQDTIDAKMRERTQREIADLQDLTSKRNKAKEGGDTNETKRLNGLIDEAATALSSKRDLLTKQLKIEASVELQKVTLDTVKQAEDALRDQRLNNIQQVAQQEAANAQHKIEMIKEFSKSAEGLKFLQKEMGNTSQWAERMFGQTGARQVEILDDAANKASMAVAAQLSEIPKDMSDEGKLKAMLDARNKLIEISEKNISEKRVILLERVQAAVESVNRAEEAYIAEKNKLPALYAKEVESIRNLATAEKGQDDANKALMSAYKAAGDASADYAFGLMKAAFDVRSSTGSLSANQAIAQLNGMFATMVSNSQASGQKLIEIRSQIAQEELSIMQQQFNALKSAGIQAATSTGDEFTKMVEGLRTASAIESGANIGKFSADQLSGALNFKDLFGGIENKIAEFGLSKLGIDPGILKNTENQMVTLATQMAETGKLQVDAANNQVLAAQEQVVIADEARNVALEQLKIDQVNIAVQQQMVNYAAQNVGALQIGFSRMALETGNELAKMGEQLTATQQSNNLLAQIDTSIKDLSTGLSDIVVRLGSMSSPVMGAIGASASAITGAARGTLSHMEMNSLAAAARREKGLMPTGSKLMMANTSEVVLTRKQAQKVGLKPLMQTNAATGNAAADPAMANAANALTNSIQTLMNKLNSPGFVQQNIQVQVDTERNVNVRGLDAVNDAMKSAFQNKVKGSVTQEEHQAISDLVTSLAERLNELGIVNSRGV